MDIIDIYKTKALNGVAFHSGHAGAGAGADHAAIENKNVGPTNVTFGRTFCPKDVAYCVDYMVSRYDAHYARSNTQDNRVAAIAKLVKDPTDNAPVDQLNGTFPSLQGRFAIRQSFILRADRSQYERLNKANLVEAFGLIDELFQRCYDAAQERESTGDFILTIENSNATDNTKYRYMYVNLKETNPRAFHYAFAAKILEPPAERTSNLKNALYGDLEKLTGRVRLWATEVVYTPSAEGKNSNVSDA